MNALTANLDETPTSDAEALRSIAVPATDPASAAEALPAEAISERALYRRSVAYFLFGFGTNRNTIITDEP